MSPQRLRPAYFEPIEQQIERYLYATIFLPIIKSIREMTMQRVVLNANIKSVELALRTGKIFYTDGIFSGKFNAALGKELRDMGATWDWKSNVYRIDPKLIPADLISVVTQSQEKAQRLHDDLKSKLDVVEPDMSIDLKIPADYMVGKIYSDFKTAAKSFIVTPELNATGKANLAAQYTNSLLLYIKDWKQEQIKRLRETVENNSTAGGRFDNLIAGIQEQYQVSRSKAKFLARQETSLWMTNFQKERLLEAGVRVFKWSSRSPTLTRPMHWRLNGHFFEYSNPPVTNEKGDKNLPGQDFSCLCSSIPVLNYNGKIGL
jgi:SPP1 gp7 family putative phage head morphogenesis protein